jgi:hypothetical protein
MKYAPFGYARSPVAPPRPALPASASDPARGPRATRTRIRDLTQPPGLTARTQAEARDALHSLATAAGQLDSAISRILTS